MSHGIADDPSFIKVRGVAKSSTAKISLPHVPTVAASSIDLAVIDSNVQVIAGAYRSSFTERYVILEYTKTV